MRIFRGKLENFSSCLAKILRNYKKYFEEIFGNLEKMIDGRIIADL